MDMLLLLISDKDAPPAKKGSEQSPVKDTDDDDDDEAPPPIVAPRPQHTISVSEDLYCHLYRVKWSYWFLSKHHIVGVFVVWIGIHTFCHRSYPGTFCHRGNRWLQSCR